MIILTVFSDWIGPMIGLGASGLIVFLIYLALPYITDFFVKARYGEEYRRRDAIRRMESEEEIYDMYSREFECERVKVPLQFTTSVSGLSFFGVETLRRLFRDEWTDKDKLVKDVLSGDFEGIVNKYIGSKPYDHYGLLKNYDLKKK